MSRQVAWLWGGIAFLFVAVSPWATSFSGALWPCLFKSVTGFACPTCGTARAAVLLARLSVGEAFALYPLPAAAWSMFVLGGLGALALVLLGRRPPAIPASIPVWARAGLVAIVLANWAYSIATGV